MSRVCMGRVCYVPSLLWAEFVMCRVDPTPVKFYSEGDSKYFFFISSDHNLNVSRFSADGIMIG